jgi:hypothetical protein
MQSLIILQLVAMLLRVETGQQVSQASINALVSQSLVAVAPAPVDTSAIGAAGPVTVPTSTTPVVANVEKLDGSGPGPVTSPYSVYPAGYVGPEN